MLFNLGTGIGTSIGDLASMALEIAGQSDRRVKTKGSSDRKSTLILDSSDITFTCGWEPKTSLQKGLPILLKNLNQKA